MSQTAGIRVVDARKSLVERVAGSRHLKRSARLRDLLLYLTDRVVEEDAREIHEQEVGHRVFGRPADYDTSADNIVRVHASTLRKRLEQYFAQEGVDEPVVIEIPKGNYAPVFVERPPELPAVTAPLPGQPASRQRDWRLWALSAAAVLFACSTLYLLVRTPRTKPAVTSSSARPTVELFWSQVFQPGRAADIVLDDAAVGLYQELSGTPLSLSDYFDRSYLSSVPNAGSSAIVKHRQTSFASANLLWKLFQLTGSGQPTTLRFARDYSFRDLRANNAVLLGNSRSNPWIEPFEARLGLRWMFDPGAGTYYPVDTWSSGRKYQGSETREGYFAVSLVPNLAQNGNVLIVSATGGSALNSGTDFLADEESVRSLRAMLPRAKTGVFPAFEALLKVKGRGGMPKDATVVFCRTPR